MELNLKQKAFVEAYLSNGQNATQAALAAGYSERTAHSQGSRLLNHVEVSAEIQRRTQRVVNRLEVTADRIIQERARLAFYDPTKLAGIQTLEQIHALDEDTRRAIQEIELKADGSLKIKAASKDASLTALEKIHGLYKDKEDGVGVLNINIHMGAI